MEQTQKNIIEKLRSQIRSQDETLVELLKERHTLVEQVWEAKKILGVPLRDAYKEEQVVSYLAKKSGLNYDYLSHLYEVIFNENERLEREKNKC